MNSPAAMSAIGSDKVTSSMLVSTGSHTWKNTNVATIIGAAHPTAVVQSICGPSCVDVTCPVLVSVVSNATKAVMANEIPPIETATTNALSVGMPTAPSATTALNSRTPHPAKLIGMLA